MLHSCRTHNFEQFAQAKVKCEESQEKIRKLAERAVVV
jgi:hypothetical protein